MSRTFDKAGHVSSETYPSGHTVNYNYDTYRLVDADEPAYDNISVFGPIPGAHNLTIADGAVIRLIIGAKCEFLASGNIKAQPGVRSVNSVATFVHDAMARLWYEV